MFYRMTFTTNLLTAYKNLGKKIITVDFKQIVSKNFLLPIGNLLSITKKWIKYTRQSLIYRALYRTVLFPVPNYFFVSFDFMFGYLTKYPNTFDLTFPIYLDLHR